MKKNVIIFDIDGTAIDSPLEKLPSQELVQAMESIRARYILSAATGRVWSFVQPVLEVLELTDPCIISAGTQICNPVTGEILWQKNIDSSALEQVLTILQQYPDYRLLCNDGTEEDYFNGGILLKDLQITEPVYFLNQVFVPDTVAQEIYTQLQGIPNLTCVMIIAQKPGFRDLHIVSSEATKEHATTQLLSILNMKKEDAIGIGDGHNDFHLFNAVGHKVAMGNAIPELKAAADMTIGSVQENGLALYLKSLG